MIHLPILKVTVGLVPYLWNYFKDELQRKRRFTEDEAARLLRTCARLGFHDVDMRNGIYKVNVDEEKV